MTIAAVLAAIAGIATIFGGIVYLSKLGVFLLKKTPAQTDAEIDAQENKNKQDSENSGRPQ